MVFGGSAPNRWELHVNTGPADAGPVPVDPHHVDPAGIETLPELAAALQTLRGSGSYTDLSNAARALPKRDGRQPAAPRSTVSDLLSGKSVPSKDTLVTYLTVCGLAAQAQQAPWLAAWERARTGHLRRPAGAVRVRQARPRLLGVHACIQVSQDRDELPAYVPRDLDADLRTAITAAAAKGGLVLLIGGSSVGKTRALYEAARALLPEWWLIHPADTDAIRAVAGLPTPRTVLWLDELQRYLNHPGGLPAGTVRELIAAQVVLVATMWPDEYATRTTPRQPGQPDLYANDRALLDLAQVITVADTFSTPERRRAETLAASDQRIHIALDAPDAGFTQVLAAGPELVRRWEQAPADHCYGKALITAALDARRVGATAPLSRDLLKAGAPEYLTARQQATAPTDWADQALIYATTPLHGATAALCPVPAGMGHVAGYIVADYLYQHARRIRRTERLPDAVWQAIVDCHHPDDTVRLADNAQRRGRLPFAEALYRQAADTGGAIVAYRLAELLAELGQLDELRQRANNGDAHAAHRLADVLAKQDDLDELRQRANNGDAHAAHRLADVLAKQDDRGELRQRAHGGDEGAADELATVLAKQANVDEALIELRQLADAVGGYVAYRLAELLAEQGRVDELQQRARGGDGQAADRLAELLAEQDSVDELRQRADGQDETDRRAGELYALPGVAKLAEQGRIGNPIMPTAYRLARLLAKQGRVDELRQRADAGDPYAFYRLADLLAKQGRVDDAMTLLRQRADAGDQHAASNLADLLAEQGRVDELRQRADAGDQYAASSVVELLAEQGCIDELTDEVAAGTPGAAKQLAQLIDANRARERSG